MEVVMTRFRGVVEFLTTIFLPMVPAAGVVVIYAKVVDRFCPLSFPPTSLGEGIVTFAIQMAACLLAIFIWSRGVEKLADRFLDGT